MSAVDLALAPPRRRYHTMRVVRYAALASYCVAVVVYFGRAGVPLDRERVILCVCGALAVWSIGRPLIEIAKLLVDWLPFALSLLAYDFARGAADSMGRTVVVRPQITVDRWLFFGHVPTLWLQGHFYDASHVHWYDIAASLTYISHFIVPFVVAAALWGYSRAEWRAYATQFVAVSFAGVATFALFPTAPPWIASRRGELAPTVRTVGRGWSALHLHQAQTLIDKGQAIVNPYAAVPSLHAAYTVLVVVALWQHMPRVVRPASLLYPLAMALTLMYGAEHYAFDVITGWACVAVVVVAERRTRRWRGERYAALLARVRRRGQHSRASA